MGKDVLNTIVISSEGNTDGGVTPDLDYVQRIFVGGIVDNSTVITRAIIEGLALSEPVTSLPHTTTVPINASGLPQGREYPLFAFPKPLNWKGEYKYNSFITSTISKGEIQVTDSEGYSYLVDVYIGSAPLFSSILGCQFMI